MNVLSLFDGMSCGQIALNRLGIEYDNYFASEIDPHAIKVTQYNYPNTKQIGSVTAVRGKDQPKIDLLFGGSPCQGFSFAGKQLNFDDPRSALFFEFVRILKETNPTYFLLENVNMKQEFQDVISELLGVKPIKINSALVSAQNRVRLYWTNIPNVEQPEDKGIFIKDILELDGEFRYLDPHKVINIHNTKNYIGYDPNNTGHKSQSHRIYKVDSKMGCLDTWSHSLAKVEDLDNLYRHLLPLELERLQTVPEGYTKPARDVEAARMLGNGWTVDVIAHIFKELDILI